MSFDGPIHVAILSVLIFLARICDVTLGTMRIAFIARGHRFLAPLVGFFEVLIWLIALRQIMQNLTNPFFYASYAGGFAAGTFVGLWVEERMAIGSRIIRVITRGDARELVEALREADYGVTSIDAEGVEGRVQILFSVLKRQDVAKFIEIVDGYAPRAFYSIEDVRAVNEGVFPARRSLFAGGQRSLYRMLFKRR
jgi:uncharacterized protein YebE (UPF0316 family)